MSANYAIYTSPNHQPIPDHLPTLIVTPQGKPHQILYTYLHTNFNQENYLLTPSDQGDLCVAKLFPPNKRSPNLKSTGSSSGHSHRTGAPQSIADRTAIRCEASRNLRWTIRNEGIQNPVYKLTLPNPDNPQVEQPLFQVSKPNPNSPWWTLFYFTYAGHLIPPKRIEFGKIMKAPPGPKSSGETKISVTGKTEEEKAVWQTLGEGNEDMVEWILVCATLNVLDDEISKAAEAAGVPLSTRAPLNRAPSAAQEIPSQQQQRRPPDRQLHPTGNASKPVTAPIRPAVYNQAPRSNPTSGPAPPTFHPVSAQARPGPAQGSPPKAPIKIGPSPHQPSQPHPAQSYSPHHSPPRGTLHHSPPRGTPQHSPSRGTPQHSPPRGAPQHSPPRGAPQHSPPRGAPPNGYPGPSARTAQRPPGSQPISLRPEVLQDGGQLAYTRTPPNPSRSLPPVQQYPPHPHQQSHPHPHSQSHPHPHQIPISSSAHPPRTQHQLPPGALPPSHGYYPPSSHHHPPPPQNMVVSHPQAVPRGSRAPIRATNDYAIAAHTKQVR